jgi:hypothetical protein
MRILIKYRNSRIYLFFKDEKMRNMAYTKRGMINYPHQRFFLFTRGEYESICTK